MGWEREECGLRSEPQPGSSLSLLVVRHAETGQRALEVNLAINENLVGNAIAGERVTVPDHDVGILADVQRADAIINANDPRGIERDHLQGLLCGCATVAYGLGGFLVQATGKII